MNKKKRNGFTIIEVMGSLIVFSIIFAIATPVVTGLIADAKESAFKQEYALMVDFFDDNYLLDKNIDAYDIQYTSTILNEFGSKDYIGSVYIDDEENVSLTICDEDFCATNTLYDESAIYFENNEIFEIFNIEDLIDLQVRVDSGDSMDDVLVILRNDLDFNDVNSYTDSTTTIYGDINNNSSIESLITELTTGDGFNPIGQSDYDYSFNQINNYYPFMGIFDGGNHTISNLYMEFTGGSYIKCLGLFAAIDYDVDANGIETIIKNLNINGTINSDDGNAGLLAGESFDSLIDNINIDGTITSPYGSYSGLAIGYSGGVLSKNIISRVNVSGTLIASEWSGGVIGNLAGGTISDSYANVNINYDGSNQVSVTSGAGLGGLVGYLEESYDGDATVIDNCHTDVYIYGAWGTGGLAGAIYGTNYVYNSSSHGTVIAHVSNDTVNVDESNIGGLIGRMNHSKVYNSYSDVDLTVNTDIHVHVGAFIGMIGTTGEDHDDILVENCYATGSVLADTQATSGFIGQNGASSENSETKYNLINKVYSIVDYTNTRTSFSAFAGGIVSSNIMELSNVLYSGNYQVGAAAGGIVGYKENAEAILTNGWFHRVSGYSHVSYSSGGDEVTDSTVLETSDFYINTLNFDDNFSYEDGYYPLLNKINPETLNPSTELVENQTLVEIP